jgi:diaminopimelate decarboxylase
MYYSYKKNHLLWHNTSLYDIQKEIEIYLKKEYNYFGPAYLYHSEIINDRIKLFSDSFPNSKFYYSVKSLSNINILKIIKSYGNFGLDVVSGGEILRGLSAGFKGSDIVYAGVGKTESEIKLGLREGLKSFHVESIPEILQIEKVAKEENLTGPVTLRLNPDISVNTHKYIVTGVEESKFGINSAEFKTALDIIGNSNHLVLRGLQIHLGSQLLAMDVYLKGLDFLVNIAKEAEALPGTFIDYLSLGGGFGIDYNNVYSDTKSVEFPVIEFSNELKKRSNIKWQIDFEPGRFISAHSGLLLAHVLYLKNRKGNTIAITDAGMSELIRPALYDAVHQILPVEKKDTKQIYDIVGPICESGDFFAKKYEMTGINEGDSIVIAHAGAYGSVMSSNYNSRPFVPEILITGNEFTVIRKPQLPESIFSLEV